MFDMEKVGIKISSLRKAAGYTQMGLADKLGISFQAVSNWERGLSMPDISKLGELSELFGVSIDEILENKRTSEIAKSFLENEPVQVLNLDEVREIAPILNEKQVESLVNQSAEKSDKKLGAEDIAQVATFLNQNFIDDFAERLMKNGNSLNAVAPIAPFVSTSILDKAAMDLVESGLGLESIAGVAPFISPDLIDRLADMVYGKTGSLASFGPVAPFISTATIDKYAGIAYNHSGLCAVTSLVPFISTHVLNDMAADALEKHGLAGLAPVLPFIDKKIVEDYISKNGVV